MYDDIFHSNDFDPSHAAKCGVEAEDSPTIYAQPQITSVQRLRDDETNPGEEDGLSAAATPAHLDLEPNHWQQVEYIAVIELCCNAAQLASDLSKSMTGDQSQD